MNKYSEDVRQAIADANTLLEAEDEAAAARPAGDWVDCACRIYWSADAKHQHMMFCASHAKHAAAFMDELKAKPAPTGVRQQSIADLIAQAAQEREGIDGQHA